MRARAPDSLKAQSFLQYPLYDLLFSSCSCLVTSLSSLNIFVEVIYKLHSRAYISRKNSSTISSSLRQIIINHTAPIFLRLRCGSVATLFVAADLVLSVESFERELASRNR